MAGAVKGPSPHRRYESPKRQEQARATRRAIVDAAHSLFLARGYAGTTIDAIAGEAGVAVQTVYAVFGSKPEILKTVLDVAVAGDDAPVPLIDTGAVQAIVAESDVGRRVRMFASLIAGIQGRTAAVTVVAREAAGSDADVAQVWRAMQSERAERMAQAAAGLVGGSGAAAVAEVGDVLYVLTSPDVHLLFVADRGWTPARYERWLAGAVERLFTGAGAPEPPPGRGRPG